VLLSSDDDGLESRGVNPPVGKILNIQVEPVTTESNDVMGFSPSKKNRLSLIQSPPKSPKEKSELRRSRRSFREKYKGMYNFQYKVN
jgi:hypothetical protein